MKNKFKTGDLIYNVNTGQYYMLIEYVKTNRHADEEWYYLSYTCGKNFHISEKILGVFCYEYFDITWILI